MDRAMLEPLQITWNSTSEGGRVCIIKSKNNIECIGYYFERLDQRGIYLLGSYMQIHGSVYNLQPHQGMSNSTFRFIGRLLIITILAVTACEKLQYPEMYKQDFTRALTNLLTFSTSLGHPIDLLALTPVLIKLSGILDALIGALILFGRTSGGYLAVLKIVVGMIGYYLPWSFKNIQSYTQRERLANSIGLLGVALLLTRAR